MEATTAVREKILQEIKGLDGGFHTVAEKLGISAQALHKTMNGRLTKNPRLSTLERIKQATADCKAEQDALVNQLLA